MPRTTLALDAPVLRDLKKRAADEGRTLQEVANDLLRQALRRPRGTRYRLQLQGWKGRPQPGVDLTDRDALFDLMDRE